MNSLTSAEKQKLTELINAGKPLPSIYKSKLFDSQDGTFVQATKEYRLVYDGKTRREEIMANTAEAPFQLVRSFNSDNPFPDGWRNMLIYGDNLLALKELYTDQRGPNKYGTRDKIKLIYIDPPFATKQDFMKDREKAYRDKVIGAHFIEFIRKRIVLLHEVLADDGSIYVQLDTKKGHYIKAVLDEVFGEYGFSSEIIWKRTSAHSDSKGFANVHDTIYYYTKSDQSPFHPQFADYTEDYIRARYKHTDPDGRIFADDNLIGKGLKGGGYDYEWKGVRRLWRCPIETMRRYEEESRLYYTRKGVARIKRYVDELPGKPAQDTWLDIFPVNSQAAERVEYPTQKPESLIERIILTSSKDGDIVMDAFAGSGTVCAVAEKLGRRWIGIDSGKLSSYTVQKRVLSLTRRVGSPFKDELKEHQRTADFNEHLKSSPGLLLITEKARKGEFDITLDLLVDLVDFIKKHSLIKKESTVSLVCPEEKLKIAETHLDEIEDEEGPGNKRIMIKGVEFRISFIEPKQRPEKGKPLKAKEFALFNAGIYDNRAIKEMPWNEYRPFVLKLFQVREHRHEIKGFSCDGYIGTHSAYVWNYPEHKKLTIDYDYVKSLHKVLEGGAGEKFYVIAPVVAMTFLEDEVPVGETTYVFLKVPISILMRLLDSGEVGALKQPTSEENVNEVIDAVGFDFISQPIVEVKCKRERASDELPFMEYVINLLEFRSKTLATDPEDFANFETFSMAMVDADYDGKIFKLGKVYWADTLIAEELKRVKHKQKENEAERFAACKRLSIRVPEKSFSGKQMMVIFCDRYGNEKALVFKKKDFR